MFIDRKYNTFYFDIAFLHHVYQVFVCVLKLIRLVGTSSAVHWNRKRKNNSLSTLVPRFSRNIFVIFQSDSKHQSVPKSFRD